MNLPTALAFGCHAGMHLPPDERVELVGIEALDILTFGEQCTPAVQAAIPRAVEAVIQILDSVPGGEP